MHMYLIWHTLMHRFLTWHNIVSWYHISLGTIHEYVL